MTRGRSAGARAREIAVGDRARGGTDLAGGVGDAPGGRLQVRGHQPRHRVRQAVGGADRRAAGGGVPGRSHRRRGGDDRAARRGAGSASGTSIRWTARPTSRTACRCSRCRWAWRSTAARCWASSRRPRWAGRSRARRRAAARRSTASRSRRRAVDRLAGALLVTGFSVHAQPRADQHGRVRGADGGGAGDAAARIGGAGSLLRRVRLARRLLGARAAPVGSGGRRGDRAWARAGRRPTSTGRRSTARPGASWPRNGRIHEQMMRDPAGRRAPRERALAVSRCRPSRWP